MYRCLVCLLLTTSLFAADLTIRDYTGRGFAPDLVEYALPEPPAPDVFFNVVQGGQAIPSQILVRDGNATLAFVTDLPPNGTRVFRVERKTGRIDPRGGVQINSGDAIELSTALLGVRLPPLTDRTFAPPRPANELPAPILAFRSGTHPWAGASRLLTERPVTSWRTEMTQVGPVVMEYRYELKWAGGGYYRATIRVIDGVPVVKISEEFDLNKLDGTDFWELDLAAGWQPDTMEIASTNGNGGVDRGREEPLANLVEKAPIGLVPDNAWGPLSQLGLVNAADRKDHPDTHAMIGIVPLHKGDWRRVNRLVVEAPEAGQARVRFPMSVRHAQWFHEVTSETSPFSTQEHEMALPTTYGRRRWALVLNRPAMDVDEHLGPFYEARLLYGVIGLDRYKDFRLEWDEQPVQYPRLYATFGTLEQRRKAFEASPLPEACKDRLRKEWFILSGDDAVAEQHLKHAMNRLQWANRFPFITPTVSHHAYAANYAIATAVDDVLAWPGLPADTRRELRARLALQCYLYEDPDLGSYNNGAHHGNPNMGTARLASASDFIAMVPDHPMFEAWRGHAAAYIEYKAATQIAPGGGYAEYGAAYHMHGGARPMNALAGLTAMQAPNLSRLLDYYRADWDYYLNLLTPYDSRWASRMVPGMANSPPGNTEHFAEAAGSFAATPGFAANLLWGWLENGANTRCNGIAIPFHIAPRKADLTSRIYPGVGVIFRAHQGPDETYMLLRAGYNWSHWYTDPGHFILHSRGAVLVPSQPYQYYSSPTKDIDMYNTVRFGHPENQLPHGWPDSNVIQHAFGPTVDYALVANGVPDWFIEPGMAPAWAKGTNAPVAQGQHRQLDAAYGQTQGAFTWYRQVMFLKGKTADSPNYFVFRDSTDGTGKLATWLFLNLLGTPDDVAADGNRLRVDTEWPVDLDITFANRDEVKPDAFPENHFLAFYNTNLLDRRPKDASVSPNWVMKDGSTPGPKVRIGRHGQNLHERHTILRIPGKPGEGYFWVLFPRQADEPAPRIEKLHDSVLRITHREGTDIVYLSPRAGSATAADATFSGQAAVIRLEEGQPPRAVLASPNSSASWKGDQFANWKPRASRPAPGVEADGDTVRFHNPGPEYVILTHGNVAVRGCGPFDLTFTPTAVTGTTDGQTRALVVTWPEQITRPMCHMDGIRYYAGWADDHSIARGTDAPQLALAFGVTGGKHRVDIREWTYPAPPPTPPRAQVSRMP